MGIFLGAPNIDACVRKAIRQQLAANNAAHPESQRRTTAVPRYMDGRDSDTPLSDEQPVTPSRPGTPGCLFVGAKTEVLFRTE